MVNDQSDSEIGNPLLLHGLLFPLAARVVLYASSHRQDNPNEQMCMDITTKLTIHTELFLNDGIVCQRNSLAVHFTVSSLVNELTYALQVGNSTNRIRTLVE